MLRPKLFVREVLPSLPATMDIPSETLMSAVMPFTGKLFSSDTVTVLLSNGLMLKLCASALSTPSCGRSSGLTFFTLAVSSASLTLASRGFDRENTWFVREISDSPASVSPAFTLNLNNSPEVPLKGDREASAITMMLYV